MNLNEITHIGYVLKADGERPDGAVTGYFFTSMEAAIEWASASPPPSSLVYVLRGVTPMTSPNRLAVGDEMVTEPVPATHRLVPFVAPPQAAPAFADEPEAENDKLGRYLRDIRAHIGEGRFEQAVAILERIGRDDMAMRNRVEGLLSYTDRHAITEHLDKTRVGLERTADATRLDSGEPAPQEW